MTEQNISEKVLTEGKETGFISLRSPPDWWRQGLPSSGQQAGWGRQLGADGGCREHFMAVRDQKPKPRQSPEEESRFHVLPVAVCRLLDAGHGTLGVFPEAVVGPGDSRAAPAHSWKGALQVLSCRQGPSLVTRREIELRPSAGVLGARMGHVWGACGHPEGSLCYALSRCLLLLAPVIVS